jgi:thymidylate synthase (FAD)
VDAKRLEVVRPPAFGNGDWLWLQRARDAALDSYDSYVSRAKTSGVVGKKAREAARSFLPSSTESRIVVTGNYRSWIEFLLKRDDPAADAEIRQLAQEIGRQLAELAPHVFGTEARKLWTWDTSQQAPKGDT